jgi:hypothetical protein
LSEDYLPTVLKTQLKPPIPVLAGTARRILRIVERRGLDSDEDSLASDDPLLAMLSAASIRSRIATGPEAGESWRRLADPVELLDHGESGVDSEAPIPPRCVREGGMSLRADVAVPANDRKRLERLWRDRRSRSIGSRRWPMDGLPIDSRRRGATGRHTS